MHKSKMGTQTPVETMGGETQVKMVTGKVERVGVEKVTMESTVFVTVAVPMVMAKVGAKAGATVVEAEEVTVEV